MISICVTDNQSVITDCQYECWSAIIDYMGGGGGT